MQRHATVKFNTSYAKAFQEVVEVVLENAISCVGGSMDVLEEALEKLASEPPSGPRDEILKEILARLLTYER